MDFYIKLYITGSILVMLGYYMLQGSCMLHGSYSSTVWEVRTYQGSHCRCVAIFAAGVAYFVVIEQFFAWKYWEVYQYSREESALFCCNYLFVFVCVCLAGWWVVVWLLILLGNLGIFGYFSSFSLQRAITKWFGCFLPVLSRYCSCAFNYTYAGELQSKLSKLLQL